MVICHSSIAALAAQTAPEFAANLGENTKGTTPFGHKLDLADDPRLPRISPRLSLISPSIKNGSLTFRFSSGSAEVVVKRQRHTRNTEMFISCELEDKRLEHSNTASK